MNKNLIYKKGRFSKFFFENIGGYLFTLPLTLGLIIFTIVPMVQSLVYSFFKYDGVLVFDFIELKNYIKIFTMDRDFYKVLANTFIYAAITVPLNLVLSYLLAVFVNNQRKGIHLFRVMFYLPVIIPSVVSALLWRDIFNPEFGLMNQILTTFGFKGSLFLESAATAMPSIIAMNLWGIGGGMILWLAALKNISTVHYEAAKLDGAGALRRLVYITIPMSTSMIFYNLITGLIASLQTFSTFIISNEGKGPKGSIYFYAVKIYNEAFNGSKFNFGYASALAWVLFIIIAVFTLTIFKTNKWVYYEQE